MQILLPFFSKNIGNFFQDETEVSKNKYKKEKHTSIKTCLKQAFKFQQKSSGGYCGEFQTLSALHLTNPSQIKTINF